VSQYSLPSRTSPAEGLFDKLKATPAYRCHAGSIVFS
jgi:hypothetical protein